MTLRCPGFAIPEKPAPFLLFAARVLIGTLFFYSGFSKLIQPAEYFEVAVGFYQAVPEAWIPAVSRTMPWIELIAGTFLLLGYALVQSARMLALLTGAFQVILGQALLRRLPIDECGCFGGGFVHLTLYQSFALDTALFLVLIQIAAHRTSPFSLDRLLAKP